MIYDNIPKFIKDTGSFAIGVTKQEKVAKLKFHTIQ